MAWTASLIYQPRTESDFWLMMSAIAVSAVFAFLILVFAARAIAKMVAGVSFKKISIAVLFVVLAMVFGFTGFEGLAIMTICTGIGLVPPMFRTRRLNMLLGFFFPVFLNMIGMRGDVLKVLGVY
jgi:TctA family transporter